MRERERKGERERGREGGRGGERKRDGRNGRTERMLERRGSGRSGAAICRFHLFLGFDDGFFFSS